MVTRKIVKINNRDKGKKVGQGLQLKIRDNGNTAEKRKK